MKRLALLVAFAGVVLFATSAMATQARLDSMGGGWKSWTVEDETNIFDFPALLVRWGNLAHIDNITAVDNGKDTYPNMRFGYHGQLTDDMVLAFYGGVVNSRTRGVGDGYDVAGNAFTGRSSLGVGDQASQAQSANGGMAGLNK